MEIESHGGGLRRADNEDAGAEAFARGTAHGRQGVPAGPGHAVNPVVPGDPGDLADPRGPGTAGESGGIVSAIPQISGAPQAPGPGGDTAPRARVLSNQVFQLYPIPGAPVGWTPTVVRVRNRGGLGGCSRLTAEDHGLLPGSIAFCLEQLSLMIRTLQHFAAPPPPFFKSQHRRGS
ncbi:hypothetical protein Celaphus_00009694 [Cervus elaphus hippelaphus]|uniref:Uncharacterized protein n=1 Tax=Cervus elaphus hippelaphus TaxID=46360 RepID=A0A212C0Z7_CEREH|nr:hypothetical protein Celaphus_00009694 [Cervus elaphus hippelaphus]